MKIISALLTILLASTLTTRADIIEQTVDFGSIAAGKQFYFNQFNTALGTLTSVTLDWTVNSSIATSSVTNMNSGTVTISKVVFTNTVDAYLPSIGDTSDGLLAVEDSAVKSYTLPGNAASRTLTNGQSYTINNQSLSSISDSTSYAPGDTNFDSFKGTGTVPLYVTNTFGATVTASGQGVTNSWLTSITGTSTGSLLVTYTYDAAPAPVAPVPEPPAVILGFGGLLGLSCVAFKRRAKSATAELA